ncbi:MAG: hypothetical protein ACXWC4_06725 [Telluria sp.]
MSFSETLVHGMSFAQALHALLLTMVLAAAIMIFRPLLTGIARAFMLVIRQRITARAELAERRALHAQRVVAARG